MQAGARAQRAGAGAGQRSAGRLAAGGSRLRVPRVRCQAAATAYQSVAAPLAVPAPVASPSQQQQPVDAPAQPAQLSFELLQGNLARFSDTSARAAPTCVMVHGILGSRRNLQSFARMVVEVLLVDLRCHGDSAAASGGAGARPPHSVDAAARDVLELLRGQRMFPQMLVGHSFGGKVVLSMARQFAAGAAALPRPVQVWVLDALPGQVRAGGGPAGGDHPSDLISALQRLPLPLGSRADLVDALTAAGFSLPVARWMTTNLQQGRGGGGGGSSPAGSSGSPAGGGLTWSFDLDGIADLYKSYESTCLWDLLQAPPQGLKVDFVRATRSTFRWEGGVEGDITSLGHRVHPLEAGHWVHSENPRGLFDIMAPSFGAVDLRLQRRAAGQAGSGLQ